MAYTGQLILRKISEIGATRCQILRLYCTKFDFRWGSVRTTVCNQPPRSTQPGHPSTMSTSDSWGVNGHTARYTRPVSVVSQYKLVSGWGLRKRRSAPPREFVARGGRTLLVKTHFWYTASSTLYSCWITFCSVSVRLRRRRWRFRPTFFLKPKLACIWFCANIMYDKHYFHSSLRHHGTTPYACTAVTFGLWTIINAWCIETASSYDLQFPEA